jgi:hypothetical protein
MPKNWGLMLFVAPAVALGITFYGAWVLLLAWGWLWVPFAGGTPVSVWQVFGMLIILQGCMAILGLTQSKDGKTYTDWQGFWNDTTSLLARPTATLIMAGLAHMVMVLFRVIP